MPIFLPKSLDFTFPLPKETNVVVTMSVLKEIIMIWLVQGAGIVSISEVVHI